MAEKENDDAGNSIVNHNKQSEIYDSVVLLLCSGMRHITLGNKVQRLYTNWVSLSKESRDALERHLLDYLPSASISSYKAMMIAFEMWENLQNISSTADNPPMEWNCNSYMVHMSEESEVELTQLINSIEYFWANINFATT